MIPRWFTIRSARSFPGGCSPARDIRDGGDQAFCKGPGLCRPTGTFLVTVPLNNSLCTPLILIVGG
jgi:hypothetical protein